MEDSRKKTPTDGSSVCFPLQTFQKADSATCFFCIKPLQAWWDIIFALAQIGLLVYVAPLCSRGLPTLTLSTLSSHIRGALCSTAWERGAGKQRMGGAVRLAASELLDSCLARHRVQGRRAASLPTQSLPVHASGSQALCSYSVRT